MNYYIRAEEYFVKLFGNNGHPLEQSSLGILPKRDGNLWERFLFQFLASALMLSFIFALLKRPKRRTTYNSAIGAVAVKRREDIPRHYYFSFRVPRLIEGLFTLHQLQSEGVNGFMRYVKEYGQIFEIAVMNGTAIVVQNANIIQKILGTNDDGVMGKPLHIYHRVLSEWHINGLIASTVPTWRSHRKMATPAFAYSTYPGYVALMNKHSKNLLSDLTSKCSNNLIQGTLACELMCSHLIKIISEGIYGEITATEAETEGFHISYNEWKRLTTYRLFHPETFIPPIWWLKPEKRIYDMHVSRIKRYIIEEIKNCQKKMEMKEQLKLANNGEEGSAEKNQCRSLVEEMLRCNASIDDIYCEVGTILNAGHDTNVISIICFLQLMGEYPEIQALCREEVDTLFNSKIQDSSEKEFDLTLDDLANLKYLERCIMETLRIAPPVPGFMRQITAPVTVEDFHFESGTTFIFSPWIIHRNPEYYPNPDTFDPDRFLPENTKEKNRFVYLPFSHGARNCIGSKFAILEMKVVLARLLRNFEFYTSDKFVDMKFYFEIILLPEKPFNIVLKKRKMSL